MVFYLFCCSNNTSQCPPIRIWFKKGKLDLEVYSKIYIGHVVGNPNAQLHLVINNIGGRKIKIISISMILSRDGGNEFEIKAQNFLKEQDSKNSVLLTSFTLLPGQEWAHIVNCFNNFSKSDEKRYKTFVKECRENIAPRAVERDRKITEERGLIEASEDIQNKILAFFNEKFIWESGEYKLKIILGCENSAFNIVQNYRFTLYESDSVDLKEYSNEYKYGAGIYYPSATLQGVIIPISPD